MVISMGGDLVMSHQVNMEHRLPEVANHPYCP